MKRKILAFGFGALLLAGAATFTYFQYPNLTVKAKVVVAELPSSSVKINVADGLGSGVVVDGAILTAAHVVGDQKEVEIKNDAGETAKGYVLWFNKEYDIALIKSDIKTKKSDIDCSVQSVGTEIELDGNPLGIEFIRSWGKISGKPRKTEGKWEEVYPVDASVVMGMSGGGVFNRIGQLVGITVGVATAPIQPIDPSTGEKVALISPNIIGVGFVVPSSKVCELLGRTK